MCGIHATISTCRDANLSPDVKRCLCNRGPDYTGTLQAQIPPVDEHRDTLFLSFTSTVLSLRGDHVTQQPLLDDASGSMLCWNGEAWRIRGEPVQGNDGEAVFATLTSASHRGSDAEPVLDALRSLEGPFAFIYFDKAAKRLYYGRDRLGRRSLLVKAGATFSLSSIAETPGEGWCEVEADGCYSLQLDRVDPADGYVPKRHGWARDTALVSSTLPIFALDPNPATYPPRYQALVSSMPQLPKNRTDYVPARSPCRTCTRTW